ncbi:hypothetical protein AWC38_SpisGene4501 [Stylophora pistillata]|uniref:Myb-like domain-containing protein n=1 Tax=Stylophora pistillata TaxID=50429 RepID=A0A2B4SLC5_STYPI|nr:hypothetical protein AWC38_SpisGene4501 [Stylophora pistillata]
MNSGNWNLNPMANYAGLPYEQTNSVGRWNVPPYNDQLNSIHAAGPSYSNGVFFQSSRQFQSNETEVVGQALQQESQTPSQNKGKKKSSYDKCSNEEQSFLVDLWSEKHDRLESKDARIAWQEICQEIEINFGTKKTVEKCQRKIKYLIDKYKDAKTWNKTQSGCQLRKSVCYDKIDRVLGTRDVVTLNPGFRFCNGEFYVDIPQDRSRLSFYQGDACNLPSDLGQFGCVLAANVVCRLPNPYQFLERLPSLVAPRGILVITSPYCWLEKFTPKNLWLGGYKDADGKAVTGYDKLKVYLSQNFVLVEDKLMPYFIREYSYEHQWGVARTTIWKRRQSTS